MDRKSLMAELELIIGPFLRASHFDSGHIPAVFAPVSANFHLRETHFSARSIAEVGDKLRLNVEPLIMRILAEEVDPNYMGPVHFSINYTNSTVGSILKLENAVRDLGRGVKSGYGESDCWFKIQPAVNEIENFYGRCLLEKKRKGEY